MLNRAQILAAVETRKPVIVPVPEWGGEVGVRPLTAGELLDVREVVSEKSLSFTICLVAASVCDESGSALFTEDDIAKLSEKSSLAIERVAAESAKLNLLSAQDEEDLKNGSSSARSAGG